MPIRAPRPGPQLGEPSHVRGTFALVQSFDVARAAERLAAQGGGYEVVHESPGLEIGVYVLVAPEPDGQTPHAFDEVYVVLDGEGDVEVEESYGTSGGRRSLRRRPSRPSVLRLREPLAPRRLQRPAPRRSEPEPNDDRRPDLDEAVDPLGFALRQAHAAVRGGVRRDVG